MNRTTLNLLHELWDHYSYEEKAMILNHIIECMNNEEAYYGEWLNIWPDGETLEDCEHDFGTKEAYEELEDQFIKTYTEYHSDGLWKPNYVADRFAKMWDDKLDLPYIEIF